MAEGIDLAIEELKNQLNDLKQRLSQLRKKGFDTKIAELKVMAIPSKIKFIEVTRDYKDVAKINNLLSYAKYEIENIKKSGEK